MKLCLKADNNNPKSSHALFCPQVQAAFITF